MRASSHRSIAHKEGTDHWSRQARGLLTTGEEEEKEGDGGERVDDKIQARVHISIRSTNQHVSHI